LPLLLCRNLTRKSLEFSRRSADLFFRSAARPRWTRKSRGPKKQVRATLPRPEFPPILGSRKAVNAQNDSAFEFLRKLFTPAEIAAPSPRSSRAPHNLRSQRMRVAGYRIDQKGLATEGLNRYGERIEFS